MSLVKRDKKTTNQNARKRSTHFKRLPTNLRGLKSALQGSCYQVKAKQG